MSLNPEVRIIDEDTDEVLMVTPGFFSLPRKNDTIELSTDNCDAITYKVKSINYVMNAARHVEKVGEPRKYSVNGYVELKVKEN